MNELFDDPGKDMFGMSLEDPDFLRDVFYNMKAGLMLLDIEGNIVYFNKAAEDITGYSAEEVVGKKCMTLMEKHCLGGHMVFNEGGQMKCDLFRQGGLYNKKCRIRARDGRSVYLLKNGSVLRDHDGEIIGAMETMTDITSLYMNEIKCECPKQNGHKVMSSDLHCSEHCQTALGPVVPVKQASPLINSELSLLEVEKKMIQEALSKANGTMTAAARILNISYYTLRYRMKKFGIKVRKQRQAKAAEKNKDRQKLSVSKVSPMTIEVPVGTEVV